MISRKGVAVLLLSSIGFLVSILLFFSAADKFNVVGNSTVLGVIEADVLDSYAEGERLFIFLENSAKLALGAEDFDSEFSKYLGKANLIFGLDLELGDFSFEKKGNSLIVTSFRSVIFDKGNIKYTITPSFSVTF